MAGVDGEVSLDESFVFLEFRIDDPASPVPKHAVMDDEKFDPRLDRHLEGNQAGVDGGPDFGNGPVVGELQAVEGFAKIRNFVRPGALIAKGDNIFELSHGENNFGELPIVDLLANLRLKFSHS